MTPEPSNPIEPDNAGSRPRESAHPPESAAVPSHPPESGAVASTRGATPGEVRYRLILKPGREKSALLRHPWIFTGAVQEIEALPGAEAGDVGDVVSSRGEFLGRGTVQPDSQILARILAWEPRPIDVAFFEERIRRALEGRRGLFEGGLASTVSGAAAPLDRSRAEQAGEAGLFAAGRVGRSVPGETTAWRAVNSEGDELPGLIVDRYGPILVVQTLTAGMLRLRPLWLDALESLMKPEAILERGERGRREDLEGRPQPVLRGRLPDGPIEIRENGLRFLVDLEAGQKTGFYIDQRENREAVRGAARGRDVLNLFGYTGAFSVYAGAGEARLVTQVETSASAREFTRENWALNSLPPEGLEMSGEDVFRFLRRDERSWDLLILDPPPFAKDRGSVERALRAYKDLNLWAFCRARPGALIWSFSCSQHITADLFQKMVFGAARDVDASVQWLGRLGAAADHPVHLDHPQGEYLKGLRMRVLRPGTPPAPRRAKP